MYLLSYFNAFFKSLFRFLPKLSLFKTANPTNALTEKELGNKAYKNRDFDIAHQHYDRGIKLEPNNILLLMNKSAVFFEQNKFDECIQFCKKAIEIGSENNTDSKLIGKAYARIGNAYLKQEKLTEALQYFEKSIFEYFDAGLVQLCDELEKKLEEMKIQARIDTEKTTSKENDIQNANPMGQGGRHCAFCLKFLTSGISKLCGKCHRRAYCSRECQRADWKQGIRSQGHKNWCHLECGEEDIDWEVKPSPGKGLGVFAKRLIPAKYRIMVDGLQHRKHPAIDNLMPNGGARQEEVALNTIEHQEERHSNKLKGPRMSRLNHDCFPNAHEDQDVCHEVDFVFAEREIQPGEEITINYIPIADIISERHLPSMERTILLERKWGIVCKNDCICKQKSILEAIQDCILLKRGMEKSMEERNGKLATKYGRKLLSKIDAIYPDLVTVIGVYYHCFRAAMSQRSTLEEGKEYGRRAYELISSICHPLSNEMVKNEILIHPEKYAGYLRFDSHQNNHL